MTTNQGGSYEADRSVTPRGFTTYDEFTDSYGHLIVVRESSSAAGSRVWLFTHPSSEEKGAEAAGAHLDVEQARRLVAALGDWLHDVTDPEPDLTSVGAIDIKRKAEVRERLAAATPGPWFAVGVPWNSGAPFITAGDPDPHIGRFVADLFALAEEQQNRNATADAEFIAHARLDVEALLNDVEFLEAEAKRAWRQVGLQADVKAKALRAIDAVVALHRGVEEYVTYSGSEHDECDDCQSGPGHRETVCSECRDQGSDGDEYWTYVPWPCPTVKALTDVMDPQPSLAVVGGSDA